MVATAAALKAPIVHTLRGKEFIEHENPYDVGMTGLLGFASGSHAMDACDALLMLGTDFPYREFYPEHAIVIQVDIRGEHIGRRTAVDIPLVGTVKDTVEVLLPKLRPKTDARPPGADARALPRRPARHSTRSPSTTGTVHRCIRSSWQGLPIGWIRRCRVHRRCRHAGHLGGALPPDERPPATHRVVQPREHGERAAAGDRRAGVRGRQVVTLSGDGGLAMMFGDLITLQQHHFPVKLVVFNNGALSFVELEMKAAGFVNFGTDLVDPNFAAVAQALGMHGQRVEHPDDLRAGVRGGVRLRRECAGRGHDGPPGAVDTADDLPRADQGLLAVRDEERAVRPWKTNCST